LDSAFTGASSEANFLGGNPDVGQPVVGQPVVGFRVVCSQDANKINNCSLERGRRFLFDQELLNMPKDIYSEKISRKIIFLHNSKGQSYDRELQRQRCRNLQRRE
jgi:hypothetical protein